MSQWTHFVGNIRIDGIPGAHKIEELEAILGPISTYEDWVEDNKVLLPNGSEGSLQYEIIEYSTGMPWITVPICGDLRDFGSDEDIIGAKQWWRKLLKDINDKDCGYIRDAVLRIEVEGQTPKILSAGIFKKDERWILKEDLAEKTEEVLTNLMVNLDD